MILRRGVVIAPAVYGGTAMLRGMGALLLVRKFTRAVLIVMLLATPLYLLLGTVLAPQLWLDPLGPLLKVVTMLIATLFTLAILDER